MTITLRDYQFAAVDALRAARAAGDRRLLLVAPTGAGKTTIAAAIVEGATAKGSPVLFLAHREELIDQASARLARFNLTHGIIKAGRTADPGAAIQVASVQTLARRAVPAARVVIVDEAHHATAATYGRILAANPDATVIGLTATPCRTDGRGLGDVFERMVEAARIEDLVTAGVLLRPRVFAPTTPDLLGVKSQAGDYHRLQLAAAVNQPKIIGDVVETWAKLADRQRTVVFAASVDHSRNLRYAFEVEGIAAEHLDGTTPADERAAMLARLATGETTVLCNYGVLTEGWDCPAVAVCVLARPTKSLGLYMQMVGRVLRTNDGKTGALVLDHAGCALAHGLPTSPREWSLETTPPRTATPPSLRTCLACYAVVAPGGPTCPGCGEPWPVAARARATVRVGVGDLAEVTNEQITRRKAGPMKTARAWCREWPTVRGPDAPGADARRFFAALTTYGAARGYKPGWAARMFYQVAGVWPGREARRPA